MTYSRASTSEGGPANTGVSVICRDMTDKEHAVRYARSLIGAALDPMMTISPDGRIDDVNEATITITGLSREAATCSACSPLAHRRDKTADGV